MPNVKVPLDDARRIYLARTYAYVAAGKLGLVILNITNPEAPAIDWTALTALPPMNIAAQPTSTTPKTITTPITQGVALNRRRLPGTTV